METFDRDGYAKYDAEGELVRCASCDAEIQDGHEITAGRMVNGQYVQRDFCSDDCVSFALFQDNRPHAFRLHAFKVALEVLIAIDITQYVALDEYGLDGCEVNDTEIDLFAMREQALALLSKMQSREWEVAADARRERVA